MTLPESRILPQDSGTHEDVARKSLEISNGGDLVYSLVHIRGIRVQLIQSSYELIGIMTPLTVSLDVSTGFSLMYKAV